MREEEALRELSPEELSKLESQNSRVVSAFRARKFTDEASKHWDLFYKRNETKFFKDRHWTTREFKELTGGSDSSKVLLEVGCGVGNFVFPLLEENVNYFVYACDFSPRAIDFVKKHPKYSEDRIVAFVHDATSDKDFDEVAPNSVDIASMVFVLSAIKPDHFGKVLRKIYRILKPGGAFIFRDYGVYDMAMLRFNPGTKIEDRFYLRQDGTTSYFFTIEELADLCAASGFDVVENKYVHRRTVNKKEELDVPRIFLQGKYVKR